MVVCQFFLRGQCKFGDDCRNEHPQARDVPQRNQTWTSENSQAKLTSLFTSESMSKDFTPQADKPIWPLSSYGPAKYEPILVSNLDESPEELRFRAVTAIRAGALNDYLKYESDKIMAADQIYTNARSNAMQAYEQAVKQTASSAPVQSAINATGTMSTAFGGSGSAFGQPSAFGAFAKPPAIPSAFGGGSPSAFGSTATTSVFGKSGFGQSAFGQTATPASASAFGQPAQTNSAFGQNSAPQSSFIKPASGAFGTTGGGAFGAAPSAQSAPGAAGGSGGGFSAFAGQPSAFGAGATANNAPASSASAFSAFGNPLPAPSAFGAPAPAQGTVSAFGAPSAFGALSQPPQPGTTSAFGGSPFASSPNTSGSVFGPGGSAGGGPFSNSNQVSSPFAPRPANEPTSAFPPPNPPPTIVSQQPTSSFFAPKPGPPMPPKPQPGPPNFVDAKSTYKPGLDKYDALLPDNYLQLLPAVAKEAFESQKFVWGKVPEWIPPKELR